MFGSNQNIGSGGFGQKPSFGGFGSNTTQTSPSGSSFQRTQPTFNLNQPFGAPSQPAFGASSTPGFGAPTQPAFGASSTPGFGATSSPAFGSTASPTFGSTSGFGVSTSPFRSSTPAFAPAFGGASTTSAFGALSSPFNIGSSPAFGQSAAVFGSTPFGKSSLGVQNASFGAQITGVFGGSGFGSSPSSKFGSSPFAMSDTSNPFGSTTPATSSLFGSTAQTFGVGTSPSIFGNSSTSAFGSPSIFGSTAQTFGVGTSPPIFGNSSTSDFGSPSIFGSTAQTFGVGTSPSIFGNSSTAAFGSPSIFGSTAQTFGVGISPSIFGNSSTSAFGSSSIFGSTAQTFEALDLGRGANLSGYMVEEIWQELATAKYLTWEHESAEHSWKLQNLREACVAALKQKQFLDASDAEDFVDEISKSNLDQLEALGSIFDKAAEDDTPTEVPDYLCCKITLDIFRDPVFTPCGITYERTVILDHLLKVETSTPSPGNHFMLLSLYQI